MNRDVAEFCREVAYMKRPNQWLTGRAQDPPRKKVNGKGEKKASKTPALQDLPKGPREGKGKKGGGKKGKGSLNQVDELIQSGNLRAKHKEGDGSRRTWLASHI